jgi:hypothetical protein
MKMICHKCKKEIPKEDHWYFHDEDEKFMHEECYKKFKGNKEHWTDDYGIIEWEYDDVAD